MSPFRRRPTNPHRRILPSHGRPRAPLSPRARRALRQLERAHRLLHEGNPGEAAAIFARLAAQASRHGLPRAANLYVQAGRSWIEAGESDKGLASVHHGLRIIAKAEQWRRLDLVGRRLSAELRGRGFEEQARALEAEVTQSLQSHGILLDRRAGRRSTPRLPSKCPYCGGTVHPLEVEWVNETQALCDYCGSLLQG